MKHVLVTGATGFIGECLVRNLIAAGYRVRALVRVVHQAKRRLPAEVEFCQGDVEDRGSIEAALEDIDGVFHLAAIYAFGVEADRMRAVNVEGTRNVLAAAEQRDIQRIVYVGSDTSLGDTEGKLCDESKAHSSDVRSAYEQTKREAHELVVQHALAGVPIINAIVSTVYGPGDESIIGELIEHHLAGRMKVALDRTAGYTFAHVDDVAEGLRLAYERGTLGESYLISGTPASFAEFFTALSLLTGIAAPMADVPKSALAGLLRALPILGRIAGKSASEMAELLAMGHGVTRYFSSAKAQTHLGWQPRDLTAGLTDTLPFYIERERRAASDGLQKARSLLAGLSMFDIGLGGKAAFKPRSYLELMHRLTAGEASTGTETFVRRTGALWLFFAALEGLAAAQPTPEVAFVVGVLRLMEVPADIVYGKRSKELTTFGKVGLVVSPIFNAVSGAFLVHIGSRAMRARRVTPLETSFATR